MPTYTYQCKDCGAMIDAFRKMVDREKAPDRCEACSSSNMHPIMTAPKAPAIWKCPGSHADTYTKTGPRKR